MAAWLMARNCQVLLTQEQLIKIAQPQASNASDYEVNHTALPRNFLGSPNPNARKQFSSSDKFFSAKWLVSRFKNPDETSIVVQRRLPLVHLTYNKKNLTNS